MGKITKGTIFTLDSQLFEVLDIRIVKLSTGLWETEIDVINLSTEEELVVGPEQITNAYDNRDEVKSQ